MCYDADRSDAGAMIFPCQCKGDVAAVHQHCLKRWLMEVGPLHLDTPFGDLCIVFMHNVVSQGSYSGLILSLFFSFRLTPMKSQDVEFAKQR